MKIPRVLVGSSQMLFRILSLRCLSDVLVVEEALVSFVYNHWWWSLYSVCALTTFSLSSRSLFVEHSRQKKLRPINNLLRTMIHLRTNGQTFGFVDCLGVWMHWFVINSCPTQNNLFILYHLSPPRPKPRVIRTPTDISAVIPGSGG